MKIVNCSPAKALLCRSVALSGGWAKAGKLKIIKIVYLTVAVILSAVIVSPSAFADGLVPCTGVNCTICDFFKLFQNIFNMALTIVPIVAIIFVSIAGYNFMIAGGDTGRISTAKKILWNTFLGIVIFYSSYVLASFTVGFFARSNGGIDFGFTKDGFSFSCSGGGIENKIGALLDGGRITINIPGEEVRVAKINKVGNLKMVEGVDMSGLDSGVIKGLNDANVDGALASEGIELLITDGKRSVQEQERLVAQNCPINATSSSDCKPPTCIPKDDGSNCNHITGKAVDVWATVNGQQRKDLQNEVVDAMNDYGFCVLKSEPWHFELESQIEAGRKGAFDCN